MRGCAPLASKSYISDVFSGVLEPSILPCVCADALHAWTALEPSASSVHDLLLPHSHQVGLVIWGLLGVC